MTLCEWLLPVREPMYQIRARL